MGQNCNRPSTLPSSKTTTPEAWFCRTIFVIYVELCAFYEICMPFEHREYGGKTPRKWPKNAIFAQKAVFQTSKCGIFPHCERKPLFAGAAYYSTRHQLSNSVCDVQFTAGQYGGIFENILKTKSLSVNLRSSIPP